MGKKRVGTLYNKPVVEGDPNLITRNEILVKKSKDTILMQERGDSGDLSSITAGGGGDEYLYYKLDVSEINEKGDFGDISEDYMTAVEAFMFLNVPATIREGKELRSISMYNSSGDGYSLFPVWADAVFVLFDLHSKYVYFKLYKNWNTAEVTENLEITNILNVTGTIDELIFTLMGITEESLKALIREAINKYTTQITKEEYEALITK